MKSNYFASGLVALAVAGAALTSGCASLKRYETINIDPAVAKKYHLLETYNGTKNDTAPVYAVLRENNLVERNGIWTTNVVATATPAPVNTNIIERSSYVPPQPRNDAPDNTITNGTPVVACSEPAVSSVKMKWSPRHFFTYVGDWDHWKHPFAQGGPLCELAIYDPQKGLFPNCNKEYGNLKIVASSLVGKLIPIALGSAGFGGGSSGSSGSSEAQTAYEPREDKEEEPKEPGINGGDNGGQGGN